MLTMPQVHENELASFQRFIAIRLEAGDRSLTPEEALDLWRAQNPLPKCLEETTIALEEALRDMEAGDHGVPLSEFDREFRIKRNIPVEQCATASRSWPERGETLIPFTTGLQTARIPEQSDGTLHSSSRHSDWLRRQVRVLRVRGPGQPPVEPRDISG